MESYRIKVFNHRNGERDDVIREAAGPEQAARRVANAAGILRWPAGKMERTAGEGKFSEFTVMEGDKQVGHLDVEALY